MRYTSVFVCLLILIVILNPQAAAGPYAGAMGYSEEIPNPDAVDVGIPGFVGPDGDGKCLSQGPNNYVNPLFAGWATGWVNYLPSDDTWSLARGGFQIQASSRPPG